MKTLIAILIIIASQSIFSQNEKKFSAFFGATVPTFTQGMAEDFNGFTVTPHFGAFYEQKLTNKIHFRPTILYVQQGNNQMPVGYNSTYQLGYQNYRLNYLQIPLNFKFWNKTYALFGPQVGFLISSKSNGYNTDKPKSSVDYGINAAFGQRIKNFYIELGAYRGMKPVLENNFYGKKIDLNNAYGRLSLGWYFY